MVPVHEVGPVPDGVAPHLAAHIRREGDTSVLRLRGALSGSRVSLAEAVLHRLEKRVGAGLILDLREVSVIDAMGSAMLRRSAERMLQAGRPMTLLGSGDARAGASGSGEGAVPGSGPGRRGDDR